MSITDAAAWWGATIATFVLLWDVYKWKKAGPVVNVSVSPNMETFGGVPRDAQGRTFVVVAVANTGSGSTTITHLIGVQYKSAFHKLLNRSNKAFFVANPALSESLPKVLEPGHRWLGGILQNADLEKMSRDGYLYCGVHHSSGKKAVLRRVVIPERTKEE